MSRSEFTRNWILANVKDSEKYLVNRSSDLENAHDSEKAAKFYRDLIPPSFKEYDHNENLKAIINKRQEEKIYQNSIKNLV